MPYHTLYKTCIRNLESLAIHPLSKQFFLVGYSGGRDSHVLLDIFVRLRDDHVIPTFSAIHIHHGLSPKADDWVKYCQLICEDYEVPLIIEQVSSTLKTGESIEAFAREARYRLIAKNLAPEGIFLSAHHQRDQAETFLLQLMRGAGIEGLRSMPKIRPLGSGYFARPLLNVGYPEIAEYATQQQLAFIEDDSNADTRFDRNFIRHEVLPVLQERFPQAVQLIAQSAAWLGEVPESKAPDRLSIEMLKQLDTAEQKRQIRIFIKEKTEISLSKNQTQIILDNYLTAAQDKHPQLSIGQNKEFLIRRYRGEIIVANTLPKDFQNDNYWIEWLKPTHQFYLGESLSFPPVIDITWQYGDGLLLPVNSQLQLQSIDNNVLFQPHYRNCHQRIKKLLHEQQIPVWLRHLIVGIYWEDELVAIPGIGVAKNHYKKNTKAAMPMWQIQTKFVRL